MKLNDIKLSAFVRLTLPQSFQGIERESNGRVGFVFNESPELQQVVTDYLKGKEFTFSPQLYGQQLDICKGIIFQKYEL